MSPESSHKNVDLKNNGISEIKKIPNSPERDVVLMESKINRYTLGVENIEQQIKQINELLQVNTGIVGGIGDWIGEKTKLYDTGRQIYENQIKELQGRSKTLHLQIMAEHFETKNLSDSEKINIEHLLQKLEKISGAKLEHVSWGKVVFNSVGIDEIEGDAGSITNRMKIFSRTVIGMAEGAVDAVSFIAEITGKAIGICSAYTVSAVSEGKFDSAVEKEIAYDVSAIFELLTLENAKKALAMLPEALEKFGNLSPLEQADGFGVFFGNMLITAGIGFKMIQGGKHAMKLGYRAARMATHKGLSKSLPLAGAGVTQALVGTAAYGTGVVTRAVELGGGSKKSPTLSDKIASIKKEIEKIETLLKTEKNSEKIAMFEQTKKGLEKESQVLKVEMRSGATREIVERNGLLSDSERLEEATKILRDKKLLKPEEVLSETDGKLILAGHNAAQEVGAFEQTVGSIKKKARASEGLPKEWKKVLMDYGIMGLNLSSLKSLKNENDFINIYKNLRAEGIGKRMAFDKAQSVFKEQLDTISSIPSILKDSTTEKALQEIGELKKRLSPEQGRFVDDIVASYTKRNNAIQYYLQAFPSNHEEIVRILFSKPGFQFAGTVKIQQRGPALEISFSSPKDIENLIPGSNSKHSAFSGPSLLSKFSDETQADWLKRLRSMNDHHKELNDGGITVINEAEIAKSGIQREAIVSHEERHSWNQLLTVDKQARKTHPIERTKDEVIAGLAGGTNKTPEDMKKWLLKKGGVYDPFKNTLTGTEHEVVWAKFESEVSRLIDNAFLVKQSGISHPEDLLMLTPYKSWKRLVPKDITPEFSVGGLHIGESLHIRKERFTPILSRLHDRTRAMFDSGMLHADQYKEMTDLITEIIRKHQGNENVLKELGILISKHEQYVTRDMLLKNLNPARVDGIQQMQSFYIGGVKYSGTVYPTNINASELFHRDGIITSIDGMVGILGPGAPLNKPFSPINKSAAGGILESQLFALRDGTVTLPSGEVRVVKDFRMEKIGKIRQDKIPDEGLIPQKLLHTLVSKEITDMETNFAQFPGIVSKLTEHMNLCRARGYYSPLILTTQEIERMTNNTFKINKDSNGNYFMNFTFEKRGHDTFEVRHSSLARLEFNPLLNSFGGEMMRMFADTGLQLSDDILHRFMEISERFDSRYGNGFASMTRMMAVMTNTGKIGNIFQHVPSDIVTKLGWFTSTNSYANLYRDYLISIIEKSQGKGKSGRYNLFRSGLSPRDKSCKDAEIYFGFIFREDNAALKKKYRIIGDFIEKNTDRAENFRTALSTKAVVVDGIEYPKGFLFRLRTENGNIVGVEPLRMTIFSSDRLMTDGASAFGHQFEETMQSLASEDIRPGNDLLEKMIEMVRGA
ncbi:MAG: hypothetical protein PHH70_00320 [Candidatus Gracilibacteria bacterium]|nr:hypothetical protein [Candidatus Gracilibacteria bacterium]